MTVRQVLSAFRIRFDPEENKNLTEERGFFMKNLIVGQSGGPTAVINSSLYGVIQEGLAHSEEIGHVYGMINGIQGFLKGTIYGSCGAGFPDPDCASYHSRRLSRFLPL